MSSSARLDPGFYRIIPNISPPSGPLTVTEENGRLHTILPMSSNFDEARWEISEIIGNAQSIRSVEFQQDVGVETAAHAPNLFEFLSITDNGNSYVIEQIPSSGTSEKVYNIFSYIGVGNKRFAWTVYENPDPSSNVILKEYRPNNPSQQFIIVPIEDSN